MYVIANPRINLFLNKFYYATKYIFLVGSLHLFMPRDLKEESYPVFQIPIETLATKLDPTRESFTT